MGGRPRGPGGRPPAGGPVRRPGAGQNDCRPACSSAAIVNILFSLVISKISRILGDVAQHQLALDGLELPVQGDQLAEGGAGHELDVLEVQQHLPAAEFVDQPEQVVADHLDVLLVQDLLVDEVDEGDVPDVLDFEPAAAGGWDDMCATSAACPGRRPGGNGDH